MNAKTGICSWFMFMLSFPRTQPLSKAQKFTQWSAVFAYCGGGFSLLVCPQLWEVILQLESSGRSEGYLRLTGLGVLEIGFILVIAARSNLQGPSHVSILGSIVGRLLYVNGILLMMILRKMIPVSFALVFMFLDSSLPLITLVIWSHETEGASVSLFIQDVFSPILNCRGATSGSSIAVIFFVGIFQLFFWLIFVIRPDIAHSILQLDQFQGSSNGYLATSFFTMSILGWYHVINATAVNYPFVPAALFYRLSLNIPALVILVSLDQIERNLFMVVSGCEICFSVILLVFEISTKKCLKTDESDSEEKMMLTCIDKE
ncbi:uncharacterized protein [Montipora capricornis]|uniref:uncharacterized protein n=1 Tax=Montipora capricornis TaxID=246305 RepID=UPI0035F216B8